MTRIFVILNARSGNGNDQALSRRIHQMFVSGGLSAEVCLVQGGADITARIADAVSRHADVIVAGGGDGTVSTVAAALVGSDIALGILPLGTLNHFAKAVGVPMELDAAVRHIGTAQRIRVDVGEVNGHVFVNNSSLGLYPDFVHERDQEHRGIRRGKLMSALRAALSVFRSYPFLDVCLRLDGRELQRRTPFVFVGNNEYQMEGFALGNRESLTGGHLSLYTARRPGRFRLLQLVLRALVGQLKQARDFDALLTTEIVVGSRARQLRVATDGEVSFMKPPLHYRIRPASLTVLGGASRDWPAH